MYNARWAFRKQGLVESGNAVPRNNFVPLQVNVQECQSAPQPQHIMMETKSSIQVTLPNGVNVQFSELDRDTLA